MAPCLPAGRKSIHIHKHTTFIHSSIRLIRLSYMKYSLSKNIRSLNSIARKYMEHSQDTLHDIGHVTRVVQYTNNLASSYNLSSDDYGTLMLAAWWHDVGRTLTSGTSMIWMALCDDFISAIMLLRHAIRLHAINMVVIKALWILCMKSFSKNESIKKITLRPNARLLLYILHDADYLDILNIKRYELAYQISQTSIIHTWAYRMVIWWSFHSKKLYMKTQVARTYVERMVRELLLWIKQHHIYEWHVIRFGKEWTDKTFQSMEKFFDTIILINLQARLP